MKPALTKIGVFIFSTSAIIICATIQSCTNQAAKTDSTINTDSIKHTDTTNTQYLKDMETYKKQMQDTLAAIDQKIDEYKEKMQQGNKGLKSEYQKDMETLKEKGKELNNKLAEYKEKGKEKWEEFKKDFNKDMDTLSRQVKDFTSKKNKT